MTNSIVNEQQKTWALKKGIRYDKEGYTYSLNDNLFSPLLPRIEMEFKSGNGDELGNENKKGKMRALHSSSALVVNVFQYWINKNVKEIAVACGANREVNEMHFEVTHPTPLRGTPPHLDVEFSKNKRIPFSIESKFTEWIKPKISTFRPSYLTTHGLWVQFPKCEKLVKMISENNDVNVIFSHLDASQLLKHILGLGSKFSLDDFQLLYLWYDVPIPEADQHRSELRVFKEHIGDEVDFQDMTYQELFKTLKRIPEVDQTYVSYLRERYFPEN